MFFIDFFYPRLCLHCGAFLERKRPLFCTLCLELITFSDLEKTDHTRPTRQAASCAHFGPISTLVHAFEQGNVAIAKPLAALMALQWTKLAWPLPDVVIPLPICFWQRMRKDRETHTSLAKEMSRFLDRPYVKPLRASLDTRTFLQKTEWTTVYSLKKKNLEKIRDKILLLIALKLDDELLHRAAEALQEGFPTAIFAFAAVSS